MSIIKTVVIIPTLIRPKIPIPIGIGIGIGIGNRDRNLRHSLRTRASLVFTAAMSDEASPSSATAAKTVRVVVKGRVQGVFYRNWTIENARVLGLRGWVRNRRDGSVEALFSGTSDSVAEMQRRCRRGPPAAVVTGFQAFPSSDDPGNGFDRKPTV